MAREDIERNKIRTTEEAQKRGSSGGKKSGVKRRQQKLLKDTLLAYLKAKPDGKKSVQDGISEALIEKALSGDVKAFECIRDTIGQKPVDKQQQSLDAKIEIAWQK